MTATSAKVSQQIQNAVLKRRIWSFCIWSFPIAAIGFGIGFMLLAGFVPPPSPALTSQEIADLFGVNLTGIRVGILIAMFSSALLLPFYAVISEEIKKIEGQPALLSSIQMGGAVMLVMIFQLICLAWLAASYRQDVNPDIVRLLNDYCWFAWSTFIPTFMIQYFCMAIASFMDARPQPIWPRWSAYLNIWIAITGVGGGLAVFFKNGPFAWNGLIGFWIPVIVFMGGMCVTAYLLHRRQKFEQAQLSEIGTQ